MKKQLQFSLRPFVFFQYPVLSAQHPSRDRRSTGLYLFSLWPWILPPGRWLLGSRATGFRWEPSYHGEQSGVGVVATQSFVNPAYGPNGLKLMAGGQSAEEALTDPGGSRRGKGLQAGGLPGCKWKGFGLHRGKVYCFCLSYDWADTIPFRPI